MCGGGGIFWPGGGTLPDLGSYVCGRKVMGRLEVFK